MISKLNTQQVAKILAQLAHDPFAGPNWADLVQKHKPIQWHWPGWLPPGFLTVLAGQPGTGKSSLCLHLATCYSHSRPWPDGSPFTANPGKTLWFESESGHRLNLARLQSWGYDPDQIITPFFNLHHPEQNFKLKRTQDLEDFLISANRGDVRLIIFDSLHGLLSSDTRQSTIYDLLDSLIQMAHFANKPILLTDTLARPPAINRHRQPNLIHLLGSRPLAQLPRLIWALDLPDPANPQYRRLSVIKNNLALSPDPLGFGIDDHGLHFGPPPRPHISQQDQAIAFLEDLLAGGPLPATQVKAAAQAAGLTLPTLKRAKKHLRIKSQKQPNQWLWQLPAEGGR